MRPTSDRVRASVFQVLAGRLDGARVLDLYAGTGALGIEALSRGARACLFVERDQGALEVLHQNLDELGLGERAHVWSGTAERKLVQLARQSVRFDLVLLDPPYEAGIERTFARLPAVLAPVSTVLWEHRRGASPPAGTFLVRDQRRYGQTVVTWLEPTGGLAAIAPDR